MFGFSQRRRTPSAPRSRRPELEVLEDRTVPSVASPFTISNSSQNDSDPRTASAGNGSSVVVWAQDAGGHHNIRARLYDANQNPVGNTFTVSNLSTDEEFPDVAMDAAGNFVVVWRNLVTLGNADILYALYDSGGNKIAEGAVANSALNEESPRVAMSAEGKFVVTYVRSSGGQTDIRGRRFDAAGNPLGGTIKVTASSVKSEFDPRIDMADNGRFAVSYIKRDPVAGNPRIVLARYSADGQMEGKQKIDTPLGDISPNHDVGIANNGRCVVVYDRGFNDNEIYMKTVSAAGILGVQTNLTGTAEFEAEPHIALDRVSGDFVLTYLHAINALDHQVVREFAKDGTPKGAEHDLGSATRDGAISLDGLDRFFVAYESVFSATDDDIKGNFGVLA